LEARVLEPGGTTRTVDLDRVGERRSEARSALRRVGPYRPVLVTSDGHVLRLPATTLPYSPEFEPRIDPTGGEKTLRRIAKINGGRVDPMKRVAKMLRNHREQILNWSDLAGRSRSPPWRA